MSASITLTDVRQTFWVRGNDDRQLREFVALEELNLTVDAGEFLTVVGPSGCGKSTVLDLIAGLASPSSGSVSADGKVITGPGLDRSVVFQQYTLLPWRTAQGNIELALEAAKYPKKQRRERAREYLELVGLSEFAGRYPHELSGGMRQRVAIARSLAYEPQVLLMDEPFGALDAQTRERLQEELLTIWRRTGTTIVFITHDIDEAVFLGQRVAVMTPRPGRLSEIITIDLDRTAAADRDLRSSTEFAEYRHRIWTLLRQPTNDQAAVVRKEEVRSVA